MVLLDSSAWIEVLTDGPDAEQFQQAANQHPDVVVPTIVLYEVARWTMARYSRSRVAEICLLLSRGRVEPLSPSLSMEAASVGLSMKLPMADSIIMATAQATGAEIWTQDADFKGLPNVRYIPRRLRPPEVHE